jgi:ketosteroid isomerase-like protein
MSQENVEHYRQVVDAFNRRDLEAFLALMDVDVESLPRIGFVEGSFRGHDGVVRWWNTLLEAFPDYSVEILEVHDLGDLILSTVRTRGHGAESETPLDQKLWQIGRWRRGRCVWRCTFGTRREALEAVGLSEQVAHAGS